MNNNTSFPLSQSQMGIFVVCMQRSTNDIYNMPCLYKMDKSVDTEQLRHAVMQAIAAHPYIYCRIRINQEGAPEQYIDESEPIEIGIDAIDDIEAIRQQLVQPFDLIGGRLSYIRILKAPDAVYLFIQIHHIVCDGTGMTVFYQDIERAYRGEPVEDEGMNALQWADYEQEQRQGDAWKANEQWYLEHFPCDDVDTLLLPDIDQAANRNSKDNKQHKEAIIQVDIHPDTDKIKTFCKENRVKQSVFMTSAYALLLSRFTGDEQVLFSTIWHGRYEHMERSMGMFVQTLPCYFQLSDDTTVGDLFRQGETSVVESRRHSLYSYADFCSGISTPPTSLFAYQGDLFQSLSMGGKPVTLKMEDDAATGIPLNVQLYRVEKHYRLEFTYRTDYYSVEMLRQLAQSYECVIEQMTELDKPLRDISLTTTAQLQQLDQFNANDVDYDSTQTIASLFRRQARQHPDHTAVVYQDRSYTYQEADDISDRLAAFLAAQGLQTEDVVSILIPRCEWMAIASIGVLKAGCTYQPLDPTYPAERLNFMMQDADAKYLITTEELRPLVSNYQGNVLYTKDIPTLTVPSAEALPQPTEPKPDDRVILLYTSGSTGTPKGCQLEHRNLVAFCHWYQRYLHVDETSRVSAYASYGFDASMMETYCALTNGATLYIVPEEMRLDLISLNDYFIQNGITHAFMTTQVGYQFASMMENSTLHYLLTGGEKLGSLQPPKDFKLINLYGPTESTVSVTYFHVNEVLDNIPIGKANDNTRLYVVDKYGHRLPIGASGELWVSGPQVGRGYLNRPEKTAEVFIPNPFIIEECRMKNEESSLHAPADSSLFTLHSSFNRVYRTGDIVRYLPDGNIQFVGRRDGQVKIRGFRIELKEVEGIIRQYPGIKEVTVQAFDETGGGKFIAAYIVSDEKVDIQALNNFIMEEKPPYMVPAVTMQIDKIPLNQNQKVDKKALPKPEKQSSAGAGGQGNEPSAPMNILEKEIHDIIAGIVNNDDFSLTTPLGYAGLTSIMAIKLAIQISKRFGVTLNSKTLAKSATLQSIENTILQAYMEGNGKAQEAKKETRDDLQPSSSRSTEGRLQGKNLQPSSEIPLSYAQMGVYVDCMKNPTSTVYNIPFLLRFSPKTDKEALAKALQTLIKAHPALTAHFGSQGSDIVMLTQPGQEVAVTMSNMSEEELENYKWEFVQPFNLKQGPLYHLEVVTTGHHVCLLMDVHHLVMDGGSMDVFIHQLCDLLDSRDIEPEDATFADFVAAEKAAENTEQFQAARDFFQQQLGECEGVTEIPSDLTNPQEEGHQRTVTSALDFPAIEAFCRQHNLTAAHLTLAATFYTLARFTNNERLCITTISNGRSDLSIRNTVGMFVNTLALSSAINQQTVMEYLEETSRNFDETLTHENYPFAQIAADYDLSAEIMFAYQMGVLDKYICQGEEVKMENMESDTPKFRVAFYIREEAGQPSVCIEYDNGRYSKELMQHLAQSVVNATKAFVADPQQQLLQVSLLDKQQEQLLDSFNQTEVPYDNTQTIVSLFRSQVAATPDNECVVYHENRYTYREVDDISERIAQYISAKGLGSEDVVSVLIPRCEWMVIASLGIVKAGCAYQPLDPSYPEERLNFMMQDADARLLIADEGLRPLVSDYKGDVLFIKDIPALSAPSAEALPQLTEPKPESLFILLYTSGSTGVPKGCQLEHRNIVAFCHWYQRQFCLKADKHVAAYASYGFDACMMDIYPAVTCGACVYIIGDDIRLNLPDLNTYFNENGITHSFITTQVGYQFATNVDNHSLEHFAVGGEKLSALNPPKHYKMYNGYGPTECTIFTTTYWVQNYETDIPIGKALDNLHLYIVDKEFNRLPPGAAGELWVSGPQISRGYLNRPEKTAEVFIPNPFVNEECRMKNEELSLHAPADSSLFTLHSSFNRVYRTGDIVRYLPDGNIQFVGRKDGQVKIRGFRIELKEVEAVIRQFEGIKDATVQAFEYDNGGKYIAAYIVSDKQIDIKALNNFIGKQKPSYMIPAATMQIDAIPLNQNQKVNRKALPAPVIQAGDRDYVAPANDTEKLFCDIFADILSMDKVGALDNFFELGGTSLMVTRVIIEADKHNHRIAYGELFSYPTPRQLAQFVSGTADDVVQSDDTEDARYDYKPIDTMLMRNTLDSFRKGERQPIGNVLLTGATGYLGIHVLKELIERDDIPELWCMVRAKDLDKAERRLRQMLFYYFGKNYKELFGNRLHVLLGDVTQEITVDGKIDTVFNCAAMVKHFSKGTEIEDVNIGGAVNCVKFCAKTGARLVHISTYSTAGLSVDGKPGPEAKLTEQKLYYGQYMDNQYIHSKFISERVVLEAAAVHGVGTKVMRVGNLAPRSSDGEFQINFQTNSAMGRIRVFKMLGCYPYAMCDDPMEFSPINEVAQAIVLLAQTPRECTLFHPFNNHHVYFGDVLNELGQIGKAPRPVEAPVFSEEMETAKQDAEKAKLLSSLLAYQDMAHGHESYMIPTKNNYTTQVLYRLGFRWSPTSWDYVRQFLKAINDMGYFD